MRVWAHASLVGAALVVACGSSGEGPPVGDGGVASPGPEDAAPPPAPPAPDAAPADCPREAGVVWIDGTSPVARPGLCTPAQIDAALVACESVGAACEAFTRANEACARCVLGALPGDSDLFAIPVGALLPRSASARGANVESCAALALNRADCTVPLARHATCVATACATCSEGPGTCEARAAAGLCAPFRDAACERDIAAREAEWGPLCRGATAAASRAKVVAFLCGG